MMSGDRDDDESEAEDAEIAAMYKDTAIQGFADLSAEKKLEALRAIIAGHTANMIDGVLVDVQTANAICNVHDGLAQATNRANLLSRPIADMADLAWRLLERARARR